MNIDKLYINGTDIQSTYGLYLKWRTLSAPVVKSNYKTVIGMQGDADLTESLGDVFYENRTLNLGMKHPASEWQSDYDGMLNNYHGKDVRISFGNDTGWYWSGRISIGEYSAKSHDLSMTASVFPFKRKTEQTVITESINAAGEESASTIQLTGSRLKVSPKLTVTSEGSLTIKWGSKTASLNAGEYYVDGLTVGAAGLTIKAWGVGTLKIEYRKGSL